MLNEAELSEEIKMLEKTLRVKLSMQRLMPHYHLIDAEGIYMMHTYIRTHIYTDTYIQETKMLLKMLRVKLNIQRLMPHYRPNDAEGMYMHLWTIHIHRHIHTRNQNDGENTKSQIEYAATYASLPFN